MTIIRTTDVIGMCIYEEYEESSNGGEKEMETHK